MSSEQLCNEVGMCFVIDGLKLPESIWACIRGCLEMLSVWARGSMCRSGSTHVVPMRDCVGE